MIFTLKSAEQNWPKRQNLFSKMVEKHNSNLEFLSSCCLLVYSESSQCRTCCTIGLRPIIISCIPIVNSFQVENRNTINAMQLLSNYFVCLRQQASNDAEICRDTVQGMFFTQILIMKFGAFLLNIFPTFCYKNAKAQKS